MGVASKTSLRVRTGEEQCYSSDMQQQPLVFACGFCYQHSTIILSRDTDRITVCMTAVLLLLPPQGHLFGAQIAGSHIDMMAKVAELLDEHVELDFVDINMGALLFHRAWRNLAAITMTMYVHAVYCVASATYRRMPD